MTLPTPKGGSNREYKADLHHWRSAPYSTSDPYHYRMARHHLFKAQTYRDHAKARYGVQLPLFDADKDERDGNMEAQWHD